MSNNYLSFLIDNRGFIIGLIILICLLIIGTIIIPGFLVPWNVMLLLQSAAILGVVSIGQTLVILNGGIDLSVGMNMLFINVIAAKMFNGAQVGIHPYLICLGLTGLIGLINGFGIVKFKIPPIIMTLGSMILIQGMIYLYTGGLPVGKPSPLLKTLATERIFGLPILVIVWLVLSIIFIFINKKTVFGNQLYAVGANSVASHVGGIKTEHIKISIYVLSGLIAGIAGLLLLGYSGVASRIPNLGYEIDSIVAVLIGGTLFTGAKGGVEQTLIGALIITVLQSILTSIFYGSAGKYIGQGIVIILVVTLFTFLNKKRFLFIKQGVNHE